MEAARQTGILVRSERTGSLPERAQRNTVPKSSAPETRPHRKNFLPVFRAVTAPAVSAPAETESSIRSFAAFTGSPKKDMIKAESASIAASAAHPASQPAKRQAGTGRF